MSGLPLVVRDVLQVYQAHQFDVHSLLAGRVGLGVLPVVSLQSKS